MSCCVYLVYTTIKQIVISQKTRGCCMKRSYLLLCFTVSSIYSMEKPLSMYSLTALPLPIIENILKYLNIKSILRFRAVSRQAQRSAEDLLRTDYSKKIILGDTVGIPHHRQPSLSVLKKIFSIELRNGHNDYVEPLIK